MRYTRNRQPVPWFWYRVTVRGTWAKRMNRFLEGYSGPR
jgi:hypothetical protein